MTESNETQVPESGPDVTVTPEEPAEESQENATVEEPVTVPPTPAPVEVSAEAPELAAAPVSGAVADASAVSDDENLIVPNYSGVPNNATAEPNDADTAHEATPEQVKSHE